MIFKKISQNLIKKSFHLRLILCKFSSIYIIFCLNIIFFWKILTLFNWLFWDLKQKLKTVYVVKYMALGLKNAFLTLSASNILGLPRINLKNKKLKKNLEKSL